MHFVLFLCLVSSQLIALLLGRLFTFRFVLETNFRLFQNLMLLEIVLETISVLLIFLLKCRLAGSIRKAFSYAHNFFRVDLYAIMELDQIYAKIIIGFLFQQLIKRLALLEAFLIFFIIVFIQPHKIISRSINLQFLFCFYCFYFEGFLIINFHFLQVLID